MTAFNVTNSLFELLRQCRQCARETSWVTTELHSCAKDDPVFTHTPPPACCRIYNPVFIYEELMSSNKTTHFRLLVLIITELYFNLHRHNDVLDGVCGLRMSVNRFVPRK